MAKVYTGKVIIPGDKLDEFFRALTEAEEKREPFRQYLMRLNEEFREHLSKRYTAKTVRKHTSIVELFIEFLCRYTDVEKVEDITRGMVNTHFRKWWKRKVWDSTTENELKVALRKFFLFLATEKNIVNEKALKGLS